MNEALILKLKNLLQEPTKNQLQAVVQILRGESNDFFFNVENPSGFSFPLSQRIIYLAIEILQSSSRLLKREEIDVNLHEELEEIAVSLIIYQLSKNHNESSSRSFSLEFTGISFTKPLILTSVHLEKLRFTDCIFASAFHLTAVSCATTIEMTNTQFIAQGSLLIRMISFPKPDPASDWAPSFIFRNCLIQIIEVFRAEVFLFFTESTIKGSALELPAGAVAQYVNCQVNDGIIYGVDQDTLGDSLVPRWWYKDLGWSI
ncbi:hypothetical protein N24_1899 [Corynebacterium suranareeae]|uniref:Uncharacterized protein n=1 Tax=Corynebacterium suranareeae TaxID=2506452 RepID=A0A160PT54_9CORY|nr:hypothetical protein [Corynebacterium suranareeae]BAU96161.1 hypothetical protein N24_1899 [Corynebacterium suranareeae]